MLTDFCEGGGSWWVDVRREAMETIGSVEGLNVLDYRCGFGFLGVYCSLLGAHVWGFDLPEEGTNVANDAARRYSPSAQFDQMDADDLRYSDNFFDLAVGFGVLHHVIKYPNASSELFQVLKPHVRVVFVETLWDNPALHLIRRFTTAGQEAGDAHLTDENARDFCRGFSQLVLEKRHLVYMLERLASLPKSASQAEPRPRPLLS